MLDRGYSHPADGGPHPSDRVGEPPHLADWAVPPSG